MTTPNPEPLKAALQQLRAGHQQIGALQAKSAELTASLANLDPLDDAAMTAAASRQMALATIPTRIQTIEAGLAGLAEGLRTANEAFGRELLAAAGAEREEKIGQLEAKFAPYFADQTQANGAVTKRARQIAMQADHLFAIPGQTVGAITPSNQPRDNDPARYDRNLEERAEELFAIFAAWQANGNAFGGKVA